MNRLLTILLLAAATTAHGQINNPPTSVNIVDSTATGRSLLTTASAAAGRGVLGGSSFGGSIFTGTSASARPTLIASILGFSVTNNLGFDASLTNLWTATNAATAATAIGLGTTNNVTFNELTATGNVTLSGSDNLMPNATTAASGSSLMTRSLSDVRYLGEMWNASKMAAYATTNPSVTVFLNEAMVTYTNGQAAGPYMHEFLSAEKYAGKTVRLLAYCRVNSTNGGNVQGGARIIYLTNTAGVSAISLGGATHGTIGVFTNASTDVFPVATSTNEYLIFTSNVGTIPTNAKMILASFAFNRASTNTTFTNNLYMQAVQLVVEP